MKRDADVIVVGLGGLGSAAAYWLSARGASVIGLERFALGHDRGASHDHSRIIRHSYHTPAYVRLTKAAYAAWDEVAAASGDQLVVECGGLDLFPAGAAIDPMDYRSSMDAENIEYEILDRAEIRRRWSVFEVADDVLGLFQARGGFVAAERANAAHRRLGREQGADLREHAPVRSIADGGGEVIVTLEDGTTLSAGHVVIAADAWTNDLLAPLGRVLPLTMTQEQISYYEVDDITAFQPNCFPVWIWMDSRSFYGFGEFGRPGLVKAAEDCGGRETTATTRSFEPDAENQQRLDGFVSRLFGGRVQRAVHTTTCLYTLTPDRDFVVDRIPELPNAVVLLGAGHAFKFASVLGRVAADLTLNATTDADLSAFTIDRQLLTMADPPRNWMV